MNVTGSPFLPSGGAGDPPQSRRALERLEREFRSSAAHRSGIGTWRFARVGWHWLPRRQRACPSAALDERVLAASRLPGCAADRQSAPGRPCLGRWRWRGPGRVRGAAGKDARRGV